MVGSSVSGTQPGGVPDAAGPALIPGPRALTAIINALPWQADTYVDANQVVTYGGSTYVSDFAHVTGATFDSGNWTVIGGSGTSAVTGLTAGTNIGLAPTDGIGDVEVSLIATVPTAVSASGSISPGGIYVTSTVGIELTPPANPGATSPLPITVINNSTGNITIGASIAGYEGGTANPTVIAAGNWLAFQWAYGSAYIPIAWSPTEASSGVSTFNGRPGAVLPVSGDYTVSQVTGAAPTASPALTGVPTAPTAAASTDTTQVATTAFVQAAIAAALAASPALGGTPSGPTAAAGTATSQLATTAFVENAIGPATPQPNISSANLTTMGISVGSLEFNSVDPTSAYWDTGAGGEPVHGTANGGIASNTANFFLDDEGIAHIRLSSATEAIWATTIPKGQAGAGPSLGAATGFMFSGAMIIEAQIQCVGPADNEAYGWPSTFLQSVLDTTGTGTDYEEHDFFEIQGWSSGNDEPSITVHYDTGQPYGTTGFPGFTVSDGNWHTVTEVVAADGGTCYVLFDDVIQASFTRPAALNLALMLIHGYTTGVGTPPSYPSDMLVKYYRAWAVA